MTKASYRKLTGTALDFEDWYAVVEELKYCSTFAYKKKVLLLLADWKKWMDANPKLVELTEKEQASLAALFAKVQNARPLALKPIALEIVAWMDEYARHSK